jgi:hypothetical protein
LRTYLCNIEYNNLAVEKYANWSCRHEIHYVLELDNHIIFKIHICKECCAPSFICFKNMCLL